MKITFVTIEMGGGGAERVIATFANRLVELGHEVSIVTLRRANLAYALAASVSLTELGTSVLARGPARHFSVPLAAVELAYRLRALRPHVVVSALTHANLALVLARLLVGLPRVIAYDMPMPPEPVGFAPRLLRALMRRLYPLADRVIAMSTGGKEALAALGVPEEKLEVLYCPLDPIAVRPTVARPAGQPFTVAMAGRLVWNKDYPTALRAMKLLRERGLDVRLVVTSVGPDRGALEALTRTLGLGDRVRWLGWVDDPFAVMAAADVFLVSALTEGGPMALLEAMSCGIPAISTDCPSGPREILDGGKYGVLVPMSDPGAIADAIARFVADPALRADYARRAREGTARFEVGAIMERFLEVVASL